MSREPVVKSTADLRAVLAETIRDVRQKKMDIVAARVVVQAASQINISVMADLQAARLGMKSGKFGAIGSDVAPPVFGPSRGSSRKARP